MPQFKVESPSRTAASCAQTCVRAGGRHFEYTRVTQKANLLLLRKRILSNIEIHYVKSFSGKVVAKNFPYLNG